MSSADILRAARARIADPKNWTQRHFARDAYGLPVMGSSADAVCWCAEGALQAEGRSYASAELLILDQAAHELTNEFAAWVNDHDGHSAVLKIYDRAIELAEGK